MVQANTYIQFDGNCEEAFNFYKTVFGGEFSYLGRFKEMPPAEGMPSIPVDVQNKIMHVGLPLSDGSSLMGCDWIEFSKTFNSGNNISISVQAETVEQGAKIFHLLSEDGEIEMPYMETFWDAYFGKLKDKFGISWMINVEKK